MSLFSFKFTYYSTNVNMISTGQLSGPDLGLSSFIEEENRLTISLYGWRDKKAAIWSRFTWSSWLNKNNPSFAQLDWLNLVGRDNANASFTPSVAQFGIRWR